MYTSGFWSCGLGITTVLVMVGFVFSAASEVLSTADRGERIFLVEGLGGATGAAAASVGTTSARGEGSFRGDFRFGRDGFLVGEVAFCSPLWPFFPPLPPFPSLWALGDFFLALFPSSAVANFSLSSSTGVRGLSPLLLGGNSGGDGGGEGGGLSSSDGLPLSSSSSSSFSSFPPPLLPPPHKDSSRGGLRPEDRVFVCSFSSLPTQSLSYSFSPFHY